MFSLIYSFFKISETRLHYFLHLSLLQQARRDEVSSISRVLIKSVTTGICTYVTVTCRNEPLPQCCFPKLTALVDLYILLLKLPKYWSLTSCSLIHWPLYSLSVNIDEKTKFPGYSPVGWYFMYWLRIWGTKAYNDPENL